MLVAWLLGWFVGWLASWLIDWLVGGWLVGWLEGWLLGVLVGWLVGWLVGQLLVCSRGEREGLRAKYEWALVFFNSDQHHDGKRMAIGLASVFPLLWALVFKRECRGEGRRRNGEELHRECGVVQMRGVVAREFGHVPGGRALTCSYIHMRGTLPCSLMRGPDPEKTHTHTHRRWAESSLLPTAQQKQCCRSELVELSRLCRRPLSRCSFDPPPPPRNRRRCCRRCRLRPTDQSNNQPAEQPLKQSINLSP